MFKVLTAIILIMALGIAESSTRSRYVFGEGRFYAYDDDSLSFVKNQLLSNAFRNVITKEMKSIGLDADLLDGSDSASFMAAATDNWVDEAGDTMSGNLAMGSNNITGVGVLNATNITAGGTSAIYWDAGNGRLVIKVN